MKVFHRPRVQVLLAAGADLLACETLPSFAEEQTLVVLLVEFPGVKEWFSFTLREVTGLSARSAAGCRAGRQLRGADQQAAGGLFRRAVRTASAKLGTPRRRLHAALPVRIKPSHYYPQ